MTRIIALVGVTSISFSAIFVRLADVAPATAGLFRAAYALPLLSGSDVEVTEPAAAPDANDLFPSQSFGTDGDNREPLLPSNRSSSIDRARSTSMKSPRPTSAEDASSFV